MTDAPLTTYRYTLSTDDALAYERLPQQRRLGQVVMFAVWLALAAFLLFALPEELVGPLYSPQFWAVGAGLVLVQYGLFVGLRAWRRMVRARHRYPAPVDVAVEQWPSRLVVTEGGKVRVTEFEAIAALLPTSSHLFVAAGGNELLIIPAAAFADPAGMAGLVEAIDSYMAEHYRNSAAAAEADDAGDGAVDRDAPNA